VPTMSSVMVLDTQSGKNLNIFFEAYFSLDDIYVDLDQPIA